MKLKDILAKKGNIVWTIKSDQTIQQALEILVTKKIGALVVLDESNRIAGIISERDLIRGSYVHPRELVDFPVNKFMTKKVIIGSPEDETSYIMGIMTQSRIRHIPVVQDGKLEGLVSIGDVVKSVIDDSNYEIHYLKEYIYGRDQQT